MPDDSQASGRERAIRLGVVAAVFLITRGVFWALGVRFDAKHLSYFWQFIEPALLRESLLESVFHLHAQPPLFNLFLGIVLKLFPDAYTGAFHVAYMFMGLLMILVLEELMRELGFRRIASRIFLFLFMISPSMILYENWLFYTYPTALLIPAAPLFLLRFLDQGKQRYAYLFFFTLAALCMTRASFHLIWFLTAGGIALLGARLIPGRVRRALPAAGAALLLLLAVYGKNQVVFGQFGLSSWLGMNLARATVDHLPPAEKKRLRQAGKLSPVAEIKPFLGPYPDELFKREPRGIPVLDKRHKAGGHANFNHPAYFDISRMHLADAKYFLKHYPGLYARKVGEALYWYFAPSHANAFLAANYTKVQGLIKFYGKHLQAYKFGLPLYTMLPALLGGAFGLLALWRLLTSRTDTPARSTVAALLGMTVLYSIAAAILLEYGENNRFRFPLEAPAYLLFGMLISPRLRRGLERLRNLKKGT